MGPSQPRAWTRALFPRVAALLGAVLFAGGSILVYAVPHGKAKPTPTVAAPVHTPKEIPSSKSARVSATPSPSAASSKPAPATSTSPTHKPGSKWTPTKPPRPTSTPSPSPSRASATPTSPAKPKPTPTTPSPKPTKSTPTPAPTTAAPTNWELRADVINLINQHRSQLGLNTLVSNSGLSTQCQNWSATMASRGYLSHSSSGYGGEIIASGASTASQAFTMWLNSPPHRDIMVSSRYTHIGSGVVNGYWTVQFE